MTNTGDYDMQAKYDSSSKNKDKQVAKIQAYAKEVAGALQAEGRSTVSLTVTRFRQVQVEVKLLGFIPNGTRTEDRPYPYTMLTGWQLSHELVENVTRLGDITREDETYRDLYLDTDGRIHPVTWESAITFGAGSGPAQTKFQMGGELSPDKYDCLDYGCPNSKKVEPEANGDRVETVFKDWRERYLLHDTWGLGLHLALKRCIEGDRKQ
ncbi:hypothetical protein ACPCTO_34960 [Streptomyces olivoreticuli]